MSEMTEGVYARAALTNAAASVRHSRDRAFECYTMARDEQCKECTQKWLTVVHRCDREMNEIRDAIHRLTPAGKSYEVIVPAAG